MFAGQSFQISKLGRLGYRLPELQNLSIAPINNVCYQRVYFWIQAIRHGPDLKKQNDISA